MNKRISIKGAKLILIRIFEKKLIELSKNMDLMKLFIDNNSKIKNKGMYK